MKREAYDVYNQKSQNFEEFQKSQDLESFQIIVTHLILLSTSLKTYNNDDMLHGCNIVITRVSTFDGKRSIHGWKRRMGRSMSEEECPNNFYFLKSLKGLKEFLKVSRSKCMEGGSI
jgi:hypothetical protein